MNIGNEAYQTEREADGLPMFELTCQLAALRPPTPPLQQYFAMIRNQQKEIDRFIGAIVGTVPVHDVLSPANIERVVRAEDGAESAP